jgi:hypothetical protein
MSAADTTAPKIAPQYKHTRYADSYKPNDIYWGLGIECEGYIETAPSAWPTVTGATFTKQQTPERYSVRYYESYKPTVYNDALKGIIDPSGSYTVPLLLNAHSFQRTDAAGEHTTTFKRRAEPDERGYKWDIIPNPKFSGRTILEALQEKSAYFTLIDPSGLMARDFIFDGDSIEIATQNYYKTTVTAVIAEFTDLRARFIRHLNAAWTAAQLPATVQPLRWMTANHPWAIYHTNPRNIGIFNNGTYHINFTAPTRLDATGRIANWPAFVDRHRRIARYIQWLQPFLLIAYGTPDPLVKSPLLGHRFSAASQRAAVSRYIGIGTYDTRAMITGKINTFLRNTIQVAADHGWMVAFAAESAYNVFADVGADINFNKHYSHGLEFRFFDYFMPTLLPGLLKVIAYSADQALSMRVSVPQDSALWNTLVESAHQHGQAAIVYPWMCDKLSAELGLRVAGGSFRDVWNAICHKLEDTWAGRGECSLAMIQGIDPSRQPRYNSRDTAAASYSSLPPDREPLLAGYTPPEITVVPAPVPGIPMVARAPTRSFWRRLICR